MRASSFGWISPGRCTTGGTIVFLLVFLGATSARAAFCAGDEDTLCPPGTNPCTITGTNDIGAGCTLDLSAFDVIVAGTLKAEVTGGSFGLISNDLTIDGGVIRSRGNADDEGGTITLEVAGTFRMEGAGPNLDVNASSGGGDIDITASVVELTKGTIKLDGSGGEECGDGGSLSITAAGAITLDNVITSTSGGGFCGGGDISIVGSEITLIDRIDIGGGDGALFGVTLTALTGDVTVVASGEIKANGTSFDGDGGSGSEITLESDRGAVDIDGTVESTGSSPDGSGGEVNVSAAGLVSVSGTLDVQGKGGASLGGDVDLDGAQGVTIDAAATLDVRGGSSNGGSIFSEGLVGTISGDLRADASNGGNGGSIEIEHCDVQVSGTLNVGGASAGSTAITGNTIHITSTASLLASGCAAGTDCHVCTLPDAANLTVDSPVITGGHSVVIDTSLNICCGDGALGPFEQCDDGNPFHCDGCSPTCTMEGTPVCPDDGNFCTTELCDPIDGCFAETTVCPDDGFSCTDDCHPTLGCSPTPNDAVCDDGNGCTADVCDPVLGAPATGCTYSNEPDGLACKDPDPCTTGDTCQAGTCTGGVASCCDDLNPCTADSCSPAGGCVNTEQVALCPSCAGQPAGTPCADGNKNTIGDTCNGAGACVPGAPRNCVDANACTFDFTLSGSCAYSDVVLCTANCADKVDGTPCSDMNACTLGTCQNEICVNMPLPCGDLDPLNGEEVCLDSPTGLDVGCVTTFPLSNCGGPICGNGIVELGEDCDDGGTAPGDCCSAICMFESSGSVCTDDGDVCTDDTCDGAGMCVHPPNTAPCNDGDDCTESDVCSGGVCDGTPIDCDDSDPCTTDSCAAGGVCQHDPIPGCGSDLDLDGKIDQVDECTTLAHSTPPGDPPDQSPRKAILTLKGLDAGAGGQSIVAKGFFNPAVVSPVVDPATNGVHFYVEDAAGVLYQANVPGGLVGTSACDPSDGWTSVTAGSKTIWKYKNKSDALPPACVPGSANGVSQVLIKDLTSTRKAAFQFKTKIKRGSFTSIPAPPLTRVQMSLTLSAQPAPGQASTQAIAGQCAELLLVGAPIPTGSPKPFCKVSPAIGAARVVSCKGL